MNKAFKVHSKITLQAQGELFTEPAVKFLVAFSNQDARRCLQHERTHREGSILASP